MRCVGRAWTSHYFYSRQISKIICLESHSVFFEFFLSLTEPDLCISREERSPPSSGSTWDSLESAHLSSWGEVCLISNSDSNMSTPCKCSSDDPHLWVRPWWAHWTIDYVVRNTGTQPMGWRSYLRIELLLSLGCNRVWYNSDFDDHVMRVWDPCYNPFIIFLIQRYMSLLRIFGKQKALGPWFTHGCTVYGYAWRPGLGA